VSMRLMKSAPRLRLPSANCKSLAQTLSTPTTPQETLQTPTTTPKKETPFRHTFETPLRETPTEQTVLGLQSVVNDMAIRDGKALSRHMADWDRVSHMYCNGSLQCYSICSYFGPCIAVDEWPRRAKLANHRRRLLELVPRCSKSSSRGKRAVLLWRSIRIMPRARACSLRASPRGSD
jgi:hypothetical protein